MNLFKNSNYVGDKYAEDKLYIRNLDKDVGSLFLAMQGRVRFGNGVDGQNTENISGQWQIISDSGSADTEFSVSHSLGFVPTDYIVTSISVGGVVYKSSTAWTITTAYFKCSAANAAIRLVILK